MFLHTFHTCLCKYSQVLVKCCTKEIFCMHRLKRIRGNIGYHEFLDSPKKCLSLQSNHCLYFLHCGMHTKCTFTVIIVVSLLPCASGLLKIWHHRQVNDPKSKNPRLVSD